MNKQPTIKKTALAQELQLQTVDLNALLLEFGLDDPESMTEVPLEVAEKLKLTKQKAQTINPNPAISGNSSAITITEIEAIAATTELQIKNVQNLLNAFWELAETEAVLEGQKLTELKYAAQLQTEENLLKERLTGKALRVRELLAYNPHAVLGINPIQSSQKLNDEHSELLAACSQVKQKLGKKQS